MKSLTEEQIWDVIDGAASPEILEQHKKLVLNDVAYKATFEQCASLQHQLLKLDLETPSMRFTENVLDNVLPLTHRAQKNDRAPFLFLIAMGILSLLTTLFLAQSGTTPSNNFDINTEGVVSMLSNPVLINGFILLNIVLFFVIVDRKVLKPYFSNRMK